MRSVIVKNCRGRFVLLQIGNGQVIGGFTSAARQRTGGSAEFARSTDAGIAQVRDSRNVRSYASAKALKEAEYFASDDAERDPDLDAAKGRCRR